MNGIIPRSYPFGSISPYGGVYGIEVPEPILPQVSSEEEAKAIRRLRGTIWRRDAIRTLGPIAREMALNVTNALYITVAQEGLPVGQEVEAGFRIRAYQPGKGWWCSNSHDVEIVGYAWVRRRRI